MVKRIGLAGMFVCLCLVFAAFSASAVERTPIGGVLLLPDSSKAVDTASSNVGLQFLQHSMLKVGTEFSAKVLAPLKLKALGMPGLKAGDTVQVKVLGRNKVQIIHGRSSVSVIFDLNGAIKQTGMP